MRAAASTLVLAGAIVLALVLAPATSASPFDPSGVIRLARHAHGRVAASESTNWFGYSQGSLANGGALFSSISAAWTVPKARQHARKEAEHSATWIGVGGGCMDANLADRPNRADPDRNGAGRRGFGTGELLRLVGARPLAGGHDLEHEGQGG